MVFYGNACTGLDGSCDNSGYHQPDGTLTNDWMAEEGGGGNHGDGEPEGYSLHATKEVCWNDMIMDVWDSGKWWRAEQRLFAVDWQRCHTL